MFFQPKELGSMRRSGEDMRPVWDRMRQEVGDSGFRGYVTDFFHVADVVARLGVADDWRGSEIVDMKSEDFYDPNFTMIISQVSLRALASDHPAYCSVRISFHYDINGHHTMEIWGQEQTYNGALLKSFDGASPEIQQVQEGLLQAMLKPEVSQGAED